MIKYLVFHTTATYITIEICVCVFSVVVQIVILNGGIRPVPSCLTAIAKDWWNIGTNRSRKRGNATFQRDVTAEKPDFDSPQTAHKVHHQDGLPTAHDSGESNDETSGAMALNLMHDDVIEWKHFSRYWPFVWGIHRSVTGVNSPHKGQWRGALMFLWSTSE